MLGAAWEPGDRARSLGWLRALVTALLRIALQQDRLAPEVRTGVLDDVRRGAIGLDIAASGRLVYVEEAPRVKTVAARPFGACPRPQRRRLSGAAARLDAGRRRLA